MEFNKIYNQDCLQGMKEIADNAVDLIVCDPPYGTTAVAAIKENRRFVGFETDAEFFEKACKRIENERKNLTLF